VARAGVVVLDAGGDRAAGQDDAAFRDDLDLVAEVGGGAEGAAERGFGQVVAVDVGEVERGDALFETGLELGLHVRGSETSSMTRHMP
jgi:hypothetical protein